VEPSAPHYARSWGPATAVCRWGGDSLYPVLADLPACPLEQRRDLAIALASKLAGQRSEGPGECIFVISLHRSVALRAAWLFYHTARLPLAYPVRLPRMAHRTTHSFSA